MEVFAMIALAIALFVAGAVVTLLIAWFMPFAVAECAQRNGRFVGLDSRAVRSGGDSGRRRRVSTPIPLRYALELE